MSTEIVLDEITGRHRPLMNEKIPGIPVENITKVVSKLTPALRRVKRNIDTSTKFENERLILGDTPKPHELF